MELRMRILEKGDEKTSGVIGVRGDVTGLWLRTVEEVISVHGVREGEEEPEQRVYVRAGEDLDAVCGRIEEMVREVAVERRRRDANPNVEVLWEGVGMEYCASIGVRGATSRVGLMEVEGVMFVVGPFSFGNDWLVYVEKSEDADEVCERVMRLLKGEDSGVGGGGVGCLTRIS